MALIRTAREAAERYAHDEAFAREFDARLAELFRDQARRLERLADRLEKDVRGGGMLNLGEEAAEPAEAKAQPGVPLKKILDVLTKKGNEGLTRGNLSTYLGIDSSDARLTRALRTLKDDGAIRQVGTRRSARYFVSSGSRG